MKLDEEEAFNSTRCIRNEALGPVPEDIVILSTPHGALGTQGTDSPVGRSLSGLSTPHGALGTTFI